MWGRVFCALVPRRFRRRNTGQCSGAGSPQLMVNAMAATITGGHGPPPLETPTAVESCVSGRPLAPGQTLAFPFGFRTIERGPTATEAPHVGSPVQGFRALASSLAPMAHAVWHFRWASVTQVGGACPSQVGLSLAPRRDPHSGCPGARDVACPSAKMSNT